MKNQKRIDVFTSDENRIELYNEPYFTIVPCYPKPLFDQAGPYEFGMIFSEIGRIHFHKDFELNRVISDTKMLIEMALEMIQQGMNPKEELISLHKYLTAIRRKNNDE